MEAVSSTCLQTCLCRRQERLQARYLQSSASQARLTAEKASESLGSATLTGEACNIELLGSLVIIFPLKRITPMGDRASGRLKQPIWAWMLFHVEDGICILEKASWC